MGGRKTQKAAYYVHIDSRRVYGWGVLPTYIRWNNAIAFLTLAQTLKLQLKMANRMSTKNTIENNQKMLRCSMSKNRNKHTRRDRDRDTLYEGWKGGTHIIITNKCK